MVKKKEIIMKTIVFFIIFCILNVTVLLAQNSPIIKIYNEDGTVKSFNLSDLQEISFQEFSYSNICYIYTKDDSVTSYKTYTIDSMKIINIDSNPKLNLNIKLDKGLFKNDTIYISKIDSIIFKNSNSLYNRVYNNVELNISGLVGEFSNRTIENHPLKDTTYNAVQAFEIKFDITTRIKIYTIPSNMPYYCDDYECCKKSNQGTLNFCSDNNIFYNQGQSGNDCNYQCASFYIDTLKNIIDSVIYILDNKKDIYAETGSYNEHYLKNINLVLISIPYIIEKDGTIYCKINMKDIFEKNNIKYNYYYSNGGGTDGIYLTNIEIFQKLNEILDDGYLEIKIK